MTEARRMPLPDKVTADDAYLCLAWGDLSLTRSHGEPTFVVERAGERTEHSSLAHAVIRAKNLLDNAVSTS